MSTLRRIALTLLIIGGINWGLIGLFQYDLVAAIFGGQDGAISRIIYTLVGLSALFCLSLLFDIDTEDERTVRTDRPNYGMEFGEEDEFEFRSDDDPNRNL